MPPQTDPPQRSSAFTAPPAPFTNPHPAFTARLPLVSGWLPAFADALFLVPAFFLLLGAALAPTLLARRRRHRHRQAITALNLLAALPTLIESCVASNRWDYGPADRADPRDWTISGVLGLLAWGGALVWSLTPPESAAAPARWAEPEDGEEPTDPRRGFQVDVEPPGSAPQTPNPRRRPDGR